MDSHISAWFVNTDRKSAEDWNEMKRQLLKQLETYTITAITVISWINCATVRHDSYMKTSLFTWTTIQASEEDSNTPTPSIRQDQSNSDQ